MPFGRFGGWAPIGGNGGNGIPRPTGGGRPPGIPNGGGGMPVRVKQEKKSHGGRKRWKVLPYQEVLQEMGVENHRHLLEAVA